MNKPLYLLNFEPKDLLIEDYVFGRSFFFSTPLNPTNWSDPVIKPEISGILCAIGNVEKGTWEFSLHNLENHSPFSDEDIEKWVIYHEFLKKRGEGKQFIDFLLKMKNIFVSYEKIPSLITFSNDSEIIFSLDELSFTIHYHYDPSTKKYDYETYFIDTSGNKQMLISLSPALSFSESFILSQIQKVRLKELFKKAR